MLDYSNLVAISSRFYCVHRAALCCKQLDFVLPRNPQISILGRLVSIQIFKVQNNSLYSNALLQGMMVAESQKQFVPSIAGAPKFRRLNISELWKKVLQECKQSGNTLEPYSTWQWLPYDRRKFLEFVWQSRHESLPFDCKTWTNIEWI